jgi:repressor LexA
MPEPLTSLERRILDYLVDYVRRNTYQPSIRDIGRRFDIKSTKTVSEYLQALADKGWVERDPSRSRGVRLLGIDLRPETVTVPWYGGIAPEDAPLAGDAVVDEFTVDRKLAGAHGVFFLLMRGSSMAGAGLADGDLLLVDPVPVSDLCEGDVIVSRVDGEVAVTRYHCQDGAVMLHPASDDFPPILVPADAEFLVLGRVTGSFRRLHAPFVPAPAARSGRESGEPVA